MPCEMEWLLQLVKSVNPYLRAINLVFRMLIGQRDVLRWKGCSDWLKV